jgi:HSP20 family protein
MAVKDTAVAVARQKEHAKETNAASAKVQQPTSLEAASTGAFRMLERFADQVTRVFDDFGLGRGWSHAPLPSDVVTWAPRVDVTQHDDELRIRVDLPGMDKDEIKVNVAEDGITIHGERHRAQDEERDGVYRSERNYGAFYRTITLPAGTATDQAKASFKNGVLEIRMPAAPSAKGRPLEIAG